jgi:hypothetical protein
MSSPVAIVMAAGKGTRMKSDLPKVLFPVAGHPMIEYVLDALLESGVRRIVVVVGYRADLVREKLAQWHTAGPLTPALSQGEREIILWGPPYPGADAAWLHSWRSFGAQSEPLAAALCQRAALCKYLQTAISPRWGFWSFSRTGTQAVGLG